MIALKQVLYDRLGVQILLRPHHGLTGSSSPETCMIRHVPVHVSIIWAMAMQSHMSFSWFIHYNLIVNDYNNYIHIVLSLIQI